jgi:glycosyltransferase involved in cell wall biosynthesis
MLEREADLLEEADAVLAVSNGLLERCRRINSRSFLVSNGAPTFPAPDVVPDDLKALRGPLVGYIGRLGDWVDYDLLSDLATARPEYSIVLVGPVDTKDQRIERLRGFSNVHFLGPRAFSHVPAYIGGFDACMIPFTVQPLTRMANPVKLFEYASLGKPVCTTPLDGVMEFSDLIYISDGSSADFVEKVDDALAEEDVSLRDRRVAMARQHDWDSLAERVEGILVEATSRAARRPPG